MSVLVIAEHNNLNLKIFTLNAIFAASQIDTNIQRFPVMHLLFVDKSKKLLEDPQY